VPTASDYFSALSTDFLIGIESSSLLLNGIHRKQQLRNQELSRKHKLAIPTKTSVTQIHLFDPPKQITIKPISLLHAIGRITTPPVPNLAHLSSTWAIIRYLWAFDVLNIASGSAPLRLSSVARDLDFHQKCLLSDEVGMGMSWYIMTNYFNTTNAIDISLALKTPSLNMFQQTQASPDFLFYDDPTKNVFVVECKGNQSSYDSTLCQLQRGTEQVPSIVFTDGRRSTSIVVATYMSGNNTTVYIVDPEGVDDSGIDYSQSTDKADKIGPTQWRIKNDKQFTTDSRLLSRAKALMYAGSDKEALSQLPYEVQQRWSKNVRVSVTRERFETDFGDYIGIRENLRTYDGNEVEFSRGLLGNLSEKYSAPFKGIKEREQSGGEQIPFPESYGSWFQESAFLTTTRETARKFIIQSICRDGTMMQLSIAK